MIKCIHLNNKGHATLPAPAKTEPLYQQIYDDIREKILSGEFRYRQQIPVLSELCGIYGVSDAPVRRALDELARDGLVVKKRGKGQGTFVARHVAQHTVRTLLIADMDRHYSALETYHEVLEIMLGIMQGVADTHCKLEQITLKGFQNILPADGGTGYLVISMSCQEYLQGLEMAGRQNAPCVLVNPPCGGYPSVRVDMEQGAFLGVNYLIQLGHKRIAFVGRSDTEWSAPRYKGYLRACKSAGIEPDPRWMKQTGGVQQEEDWRALDELMQLDTPPTALFAASDYRAIHLLNRCRQKGISVPRELSICGYDDIAESVAIQPRLTTVLHPRYLLGVQSVEMLVAMLDGHAEAHEERLTAPKLMVRDTCAAPAR